MDGEGGSRKRARITSDATPPVPQQNSTMASTTPTHSPTRRPCHHETNLATLNKDVTDMRSLVTCKICVKLLYEPYSLACGHTYCYSCLSNWISQAQRATCPDCRSGIKQEPVPSYLIREMTLVFLNRRELLPDGETTEEHAQWAKEEAEIVARDKADTDPRTGGLFKGRFMGGIARALMPIHDASDAVERCPICLYEVEDGWCNQCQIPVGEDEMDDGYGPAVAAWSDDSISDDDSELDDDLEAEDHAENERAFYMGDESEMEYEDDDEGLADQLFGGGRPWRNRRRVDGISSDENDGEDEDDTNLDGFIVNDDEEGERAGQGDITIEHESDSEDSEPHAPRQHRRRAARVVEDEEDDDDSDDEEADGDDVVSGAQDRSSRVDGQIAGGGSFGRKRNTIVRSRARPIAIDSEDESSSEEDEDDAPIDSVARRDADRGYGTTLNYEQDRLAEYGHDYHGFDYESEIDGDVFEGDDAGYNFDPYNNYNAGAAFSSEEGSEDGDGSDEDEDDEEETFVDPNNASSYWPEEDEDEDEDGEDSSSTVGHHTPSDTRSPQPNPSFRLTTGNAHRDRNRSVVDATRSVPRRPAPPPAHPFQLNSILAGINDRSYPSTAQQQNHPRLRMSAPHHVPRRPAPPPAHPFQLSSTLAGINDRSYPSTAQQQNHPRLRVSAPHRGNDALHTTERHPRFLEGGGVSLRRIASQGSFVDGVQTRQARERNMGAMHVVTPVYRHRFYR